MQCISFSATYPKSGLICMKFSKIVQMFLFPATFQFPVPPVYNLSIHLSKLASVMWRCSSSKTKSSDPKEQTHFSCSDSQTYSNLAHGGKVAQLFTTAVQHKVCISAACRCWFYTTDTNTSTSLLGSQTCFKIIWLKQRGLIDPFEAVLRFKKTKDQCLRLTACISTIKMRFTHHLKGSIQSVY